MPLERHGLRWIHPEACYAHPLPGRARRRRSTATSPGPPPGSTPAHPGDGERWRDFVEPLLAASRPSGRRCSRGFPPLGGPLKLLAGLGPLGAAGFGRLLPSSAQGSGRGSSAGPMRAPGCTARRATATSRRPARGARSPSLPEPARPRGGLAQSRGRRAAADRRARLAPARAGRHRPHRRAGDGVESDGRGVTGVRLAGGERIGGDAVVATVMPHALVRLAPEALPRRYSALLDRYRYGPATVKVDWALDGADPVGRPTPLAAPEPSISRAPRASCWRRSPTRSTTCPSGRSCCWASSPWPTRAARPPASTRPGRTRTGRNRGSTGRASSTVTSTGWRPRSSATPLASATASSRATCSARPSSSSATPTSSAATSAAAVPPHQVVFRPAPGVNPYRTPLRGLFLGSAAAFPGGAVHGVPGDAAARAALSRARDA